MANSIYVDRWKVFSSNWVEEEMMYSHTLENYAVWLFSYYLYFWELELRLWLKWLQSWLRCLTIFIRCFVSFQLPDGFRGFPTLTKLHIQLLYVNRKDLEHMLSHCYNLEWLHIDRCDLNDELIVNSPLSHLLYLCRAWEVYQDKVPCCQSSNLWRHRILYHSLPQPLFKAEKCKYWAAGQLSFSAFLGFRTCRIRHCILGWYI
jgi:hypothetical protein